MILEVMECRSWPFHITTFGVAVQYVLVLHTQDVIDGSYMYRGDPESGPLSSDTTYNN